MMRKACIEQTNVDEKYINATRDGNVPDVPELKCYILCILEHSGIIDANDDTIDFDMIYHLMPPSSRTTMEYVLKECGTKRMTLVLTVSNTFISHSLNFN